MSLTEFCLSVYVIVVLCIRDASGNIGIRPQNTIMMAGGTARLNCTFVPGDVDPYGSVYWTTKDDVEITPFGGACISQFSQFTTITNLQGSCDLQVVPSSITTSDSYRCKEFGAVVDEAYLTLVILASVPTCVPDLSNSKLVCNGNFQCYKAPDSNLPSAWFTCDGLGDGPKVTYTELGSATYPMPETTFNLVISGSSVPAYVCRMSLDFSANSGYYATNTAVYEFTTQSIGHT